MNRAIILSLVLLAFAGCDKVGVGGRVAQVFGDWAEVKLPEGCKARQISASGNIGGIAVLCEDGRVFH